MTQGEPRPTAPHEVGVVEQEPEAMQIEGAHLLATKAKDRLRAAGFDDEQILAWAESYIAEQGSGDVEALVVWIRDRQDEQRPPVRGGC